MSAGEAGFDYIIERERGLRRDLSARRMTMIAIGGAIGTGLFLGSGFAIGLAGPGVLVSYVIGALIALLLMGCLAEMTVAHPTSGSFGAYAEHYIGPLTGYLVRYAYWTGNVLAVGTEVTAIVLFIVLASFIVLRASGARAGAGAAAAAAVGFHNYTAYGGFLPKGVWGVWVAVIIAIFSYFSVEMIAVAAGEAAQPEVAVSRAFRSTVFRLILFYLLTLALVLAIVPWTAAGIDESPFVKVMRALGVPGAAGIFNFVILVAALSAMNSQLYITTRMMFSLSRAGHAPRRFGTLSRRGVPVQALLLSSLGIAFAAVLSVVSPKSAYILMVSISAFGTIFARLINFITHYRFRRA